LAEAPARPVARDLLIPLSGLFLNMKRPLPNLVARALLPVGQELSPLSLQFPRLLIEGKVPVGAIACTLSLFLLFLFLLVLNCRASRFNSGQPPLTISFFFLKTTLPMLNDLNRPTLFFSCVVILSLSGLHSAQSPVLMETLDLVALLPVTLITPFSVSRSLRLFFPRCDISEPLPGCSL